MASRFWVSQPVSGAIVSVSSPPRIRLTVASTTGMTTGDARQVYGVVGTTEANGTWTITVIDATHIDLQGSTFSNVYTSGGSVNGQWTATNTNNWVSSSAGTDYGQTVPGSSDVAVLDGSSGTGTVTMNFGGAVTLQSLQMGAFVGTWDNSVNNNNMTMTVGSAISGSASVVLSGSGTRTYKFGTATYTLSATGANQYLINMGIATNATVTAGSETWVISGVTQNVRLLNFSASVVKAFGALTMNANTGLISFGGIETFTTITASGGVTLMPTFGTNITCTTLALNGSSSNLVGIFSSTLGSQSSSTISVASGTQTLTWCAIKDSAFTGGATFIANNSYNLGDNTGITITAPPSPPIAQIVSAQRGTPY